MRNNPEERNSHPVYSKDDAVLVQAWTGPEVSRRLRIPDF